MSKAALLGCTRALAKGGDAAEGAIRQLFHKTIAWHGPHPLNEVAGVDAYLTRVWRPLVTALPDVERRDDIVIAGRFKAGDWTAALGHLVGTFAAPWLEIPPTGRTLSIRYGEFLRYEGGRAVEAYTIYDLLDVFRQAGIRLTAPSLGAEERWAAPATHDGIVPEPADPAETAASTAAVDAMLQGLGAYDGRTLASMGQVRFWAPAMMWYGPGGIGTTRGLKGFEDHHQIPFLEAFPDRRGGNHKCRMAEGAYVASTGWPSIHATHSGGSFMGLPPTGRRITMRVMDFWRREGDLLAENWVFIDLIDLLRQMGIDLLARFAVQGTVRG